jgi:glycosyltransferase involved in cell wall biosynthesis
MWAAMLCISVVVNATDRRIAECRTPVAVRKLLGHATDGEEVCFMPASKVVHVTSAHPPSDVRIFQKECRTLAAAGYDVVFVVPHDRDETVDGVRLRAIAPARGRFERMTRTSWRAVRAAAAEKAEIYHLHDPDLLLWSLFLRLRGGHVVFDMHEDMPKSVLTKLWLPPWLCRALSSLTRIGERALLTGMPVIFAETSYQWNRPWVKRSTTVLNKALVDELLAIKAAKHTVFTICYVGWVFPDRGALNMLAAMEILADRGRAAEFECVGPIADECREEVMERARRTRLPVRMSGERLPPSEAWRMTARCHVGLAVLRGIPNNYAIEPTKLFEYMALGIPVIASSFPSYRTVVEGSACGLCVNPESPEEVAKAIEWLMDHPSEAAEMGRRGRDAVMRQYNWKHEAAKLLRLYDELLAAAPGAPVAAREA